MALKPWYTVVTPRQDLREGRPLDASEFAVHLDHVRDGRAPEVYQEPHRFFERTFLTHNLTLLAAEVIRRLSGELTETSAVFNMATQFGGGKTHALTLLYHLATNGPNAARWPGVERVLAEARVREIPLAATAAFVGTEFDSLVGRGGDDGTPVRKTPWGEIAWQLGGEGAFAVVAEHDRQLIAPAGDVIHRFLPGDRPSLILMDELMNYVSRSRRLGVSTQLYNFLQNLSEVARNRTNVVLVASIPASELEMSAEDHADYERLKKVLDRLGKAVMMSADTETSEIIRRRLFEWDERAVTQDGRVMLPRDATQTCEAYAGWVIDHHEQLPEWFPADHARDAFFSTYPFHPSVLSVFERKWQSLPRFQRTRGVLRLLALWVSRAYSEGFKQAYRDPLLGLGTAPLDDPIFRAAVYEQMGEQALEIPVTTDIIGHRDSWAIRLDEEAVDTIRKSRLHRKVGTAIFFESNGGQTTHEASLPEIRLGVGEPDLDIGNVETVLEDLVRDCYYLRGGEQRNRYRFGLTPTLNKVVADRRASVKTEAVDERVGTEVRKIFELGPAVARVFFPESSGQLPDRPVLTMAILPPDQSASDLSTVQMIESMTQEYGASARKFKNAVIWCTADGSTTLRNQARDVLAWEDIRDDEGSLQIDDGQRRQLAEQIARAQRDLREAVWRSYKTLLLLGRDNTVRSIDLGLVHSSAATSLSAFILNRLQQDGEIENGISPNFLVRNWPPAFDEWSTKAVRDAFFASPQFPRLLDGDLIRDTIARGVRDGALAYVGRTPTGDHEPFLFECDLNPSDVEIVDDMYVITRATAERYREERTKPPTPTTAVISPSTWILKPGESKQFTARVLDQNGREMSQVPRAWSSSAGEIDQDGVFAAPVAIGVVTISVVADGAAGTARVDVRSESGPGPISPQPGDEKMTHVSWSGTIPPQKWANFYMRVLTAIANDPGLRLQLNVGLDRDSGISEQQIDEMRAALRELGLDDHLNTY